MHRVHYRALIPCADYMLSVSELETNHCTLTQTGLWSLGAAGSSSMDGPCQSRRPNQEDLKLILDHDSAQCLSRDGSGGPPRQRAAECWPALVPDSDGVSLRHYRPTAMRTRTRSSCCRSGRGLEKALCQPQMLMTAMVVTPPHRASRRPRHRVTACRVRCTRGSVRGVGSVSQAWSCLSVQ